MHSHGRGEMGEHCETRAVQAQLQQGLVEQQSLSTLLRGDVPLSATRLWLLWSFWGDISGEAKRNKEITFPLVLLLGITSLHMSGKGGFPVPLLC